MATAQKNERSLEGLAPSHSLAVVLTMAALIVGFAAMLPLVQSSGATSTAGRIQQMEEEKASLQARLRELELEVAELGSLSRVEAEARTRLQMEAPTKVYYVPVDAPPPEERKLPTRFLPPDREDTPGDSSLIDDVIDWLSP
jgi:cell division protein FtsL